MTHHGLTPRKTAMKLFADGYGWEDAFVKLVASKVSMCPERKALLRNDVFDWWKQYAIAERARSITILKRAA